MLNYQTRIICNHCGEPIKPRDGVILAGNLYIITDDIKARAGVVGSVDPHTNIIDTSEKAFHIACLIRIMRAGEEPREK